MKRISGVVGLLAFLLVVAVPPLAAEEAEALAEPDPEATAAAAQDEEPDDEAPVVREAITVTATKREENPKDVPIALSTLSGEQLDLVSSGGADVRAISARTPSLLIESSFGRAFPRFYMRGLGNTDFDLNASQPVSMLYDDVVLENPILKGMPIWDMQQVEVVRGPQGTLFGRNTPAGVVKFQSALPSQDFEASVGVSWGTYNTTDVRGVLNGSLGETVSARLSVLYQGRSDWVDNTFTGENDALGGYDTGAIRLQFLFEPSENLTALLNLHAWDVDGTARLFRANLIEQGTNNIRPDFEFDKIAIDGLNSQDIEAQGGVFRLDYDFGDLTLTSVTGFETLEMYSRGDVDGGFGAVFAPPFGPGFIPFAAESADGLPDLDQLTQEIRIASNNESGFNWLAGVFYFDEELQADTFNFNSLAPGNPQDGYSFQRQQAESWAVFASIDLEPAERWDVKLGLRYTDDQKDFSAERPEATFQNTPTVRPITRQTDADNVSWDASATYAATEDINVYGRVATSFRAPSIQGRILFCPDLSGGLNPATNCVSVADEEEILSYEVGIKSELLDNRLIFNAATFLYEVDGQQIVAVGGQFNTATLLNADTTNGYGFETDISYAPSPEWLITLGGSYNNTEIDDPNLVIAPCGGGCTILDPVDAAGNVFVDGNSLPHAPEWIFNGIVDYRRPVGSGLFLASFDWAYYDDKRFFLYESAEFHDDSFEIGVRFAYSFGDGQYEAGIFGRNITDEEIVRGGIDFINLTGMVNEPAIWGAELKVNF
ncbi:MAG: TonB-dependent receptor [Thermoanaerobaculia bacterium]|nr:TonB-dependent receptor [Thermoanaerobaculia bacterium]